MKSEFKDFNDIEIKDKIMYPGMISIPQLIVDYKRELEINSNSFNFDAGVGNSFRSISLNDYESYNKENRFRDWLQAVFPSNIAVSGKENILSYIKFIEYIFLLIDNYHAESNFITLIPDNIKNEINVHVLIAFYYKRELRFEMSYFDSKLEVLRVLGSSHVASRCQDFLRHTALNERKEKLAMTALSGIISPKQDFLEEMLFREHLKDNQILSMEDTDDSPVHPLLLMKDITKLLPQIGKDLFDRKHEHYWWAFAKATNDITLLKRIISNSTDATTLIVATEKLFELGETEYVKEIALNKLRKKSLMEEVPTGHIYFEKPYSEMHYDGCHGVMTSAQRRAIQLLGADLELVREVEEHSEDMGVDLSLVKYYEKLNDLIRIKNKWENILTEDPNLVVFEADERIKHRPQSLDFILD